ncbi:unnamed protein product [Schistocephalus solidus]|uniref:RT_RNaseH domain-containing protein n=1 Tax=Schistocephalus solidus TaxID=70667 RepID=A0A183TF47_SCHSO|nr:unnamed protein product [Schistocephalus solidus]
MLQVGVIREFPPLIKRQLKRFLGKVNFYQRILLNFVHTTLPLMRLLLGSFEQCADALTAFVKVKAVLTDAALLTHPAPNASTSLLVSTSKVAVGPVLHLHPPVWVETSCHPLAMKHFRHFLKGRNFNIYMDHKPLSFALKSTSSTPGKIVN